MKKFKLFTVLTLIVLLFSTCANQGETQQKLYGNENGLPDELRV
jgi:PBP1b-binding outer membrane lipoprotein LpoB